MAFKRRQDEYDSSFEGDAFVPKRVCSGGGSSKAGQRPGAATHLDSLLQPKHHATSSAAGLPSHSSLNDLSCVSIGQALRYHQSSLTAYDRHKMLVNQYLLYHPGATEQLQRDSSRDRRDMDVVRDNHQFLWSEDEQPDTWQRQLAKKYYDKLFREYCICDLSRYKENKIGMRWRVESEVQSSKGQFSCGEKHCTNDTQLTSWEMNFAYVEQGTKKNALIKLRLCEPCSVKLNFCHKRKKATKKKKKKKKRRVSRSSSPESDTPVYGEQGVDTAAGTADQKADTSSNKDDGDNIWKGPAKLPDEKNRDEEFEEYLEDLLL